MTSAFIGLTTSNKAVDGLKTNLSYSGGQCAISANGYTSVEWWVDLGDLSTIQNIKIYYRTENVPWDQQLNTPNGFPSRFLGFSVYVSNTTDKEEGLLCFHDNTLYNLSTILPVLTIECKIKGRFVIYYNERKQGQPTYYSSSAIIELCEFEVNGCLRGHYGDHCMESCPVNCLDDMCDIDEGTCFACDIGYKGSLCDNECDGGMYGEGCSLPCGACNNNTQCHHINGDCLQGCGPGFQGQTCEQECPRGKYGIDCRYDCSVTCGTANRCNKTTGECVGGCQPGWKGFYCDQECGNGTFGPWCGHKCGECVNGTQCNNINGICEFGCAPGFLGLTCNEECPIGKYGVSCADNCSLSCSKPYHCEGRTGKCVGGCQPGWKGVQCDKECDVRTYGDKCSLTCGACINNSQCHHISGTCSWGCDVGFKGMRCIQESGSLGDKYDTCITDTVISVTISTFIVILGTIINIAFWRRNRLNNSKHSQNTSIKGNLANPGIVNESTYTELGAVNNKQNTYDDLHHYS